MTSHAFAVTTLPPMDTMASNTMRSVMGISPITAHTRFDMYLA
jgi:hypothetical protein